jgi:hypothetical protein
MIHEVIINQSFSDFLKKHERIILKLFDIIKTFKKNIPNTYKYSLKHPPLKSNYKYTDKLFIGCILYITLNNSSWTSFIGPIPGKQVHKKFREYSLKNCFEKLFKTSIEEYLCTIKMKKNNKNIISTDTSNIYNRNCEELIHKNPYMKNKKCIKISTFVDSRGCPLNISINDSITHDSKIFINDFNKIIDNKDIKKKFNKNTLILADKGYDSKNVRNIIRKSKMDHIIAYNRRNTKNKSKIRKLTKYQKKIYKKRIKVEHYFGIIKRYPKINVIYEKSLSSYYNILLLVSSLIIINRIMKMT